MKTETIFIMIDIPGQTGTVKEINIEIPDGMDDDKQDELIETCVQKMVSWEYKQNMCITDMSETLHSTIF